MSTDNTPFHKCTLDKLYEMWMSRAYTNVPERIEAEISFWEVIDGENERYRDE